MPNSLKLIHPDGTTYTYKPSLAAVIPAKRPPTPPRRSSPSP